VLSSQGIFPNSIMRGPIGDIADAQTYAEIDRLLGRLRRAVDGG